MCLVGVVSVTLRSRKDNEMGPISAFDTIIIDTYARPQSTEIVSTLQPTSSVRVTLKDHKKQCGVAVKSKAQVS